MVQLRSLLSGDRKVKRDQAGQQLLTPVKDTQALIVVRLVLTNLYISLLLNPPSSTGIKLRLNIPLSTLPFLGLRLVETLN